MKNLLLICVILILSWGQLFAGPVDVNTAKSIGEKFVKVNMASVRDFQNSELVYTLCDDNKNPCLYVFNIDNNGFYVVSADTRTKPILAYSEEGSVDINNMPDGFAYYLNHYKNMISYLITNDLDATQDIIDEWNLVRTKGTVSERGIGKSVGPLINLLWNQDYPYNYYCPMGHGGPNGHAYVGCAADAMAMVMKYWNYPETGVGSHSYTPPGYPQQTVNFGETTYDWVNMPVSISAGSNIVNIQAVALLMYHCGVSIDMQYGPNGSGAYSQDVDDAMSGYFRYAPQMEQRNRDVYSKTEWEDMLIANLDQSFPAYYSGSQNSEGHAFVCDGYNENRYFHFNWGWSGYANGYFAIDALNTYNGSFNENQAAYFDMIPDYAYNIMPMAPEISVKYDNAYSHKGIINIMVPTMSEAGNVLTSIDQLIVLRDDVIIHTENNPAPGSVITFEDNVENYDCYTYTTYAVSNNIKGRFANVKLQYGPTCTWKIVCTTTNFQGWNDAKLQVLNSFGTVIEEITLTSSTSISEHIAMPEGDISFKWVAPSSTVQNMSIKIKDSSNSTVYNYSGSSTGLTAGVIFSVDNTCDGCKAPDNLNGEYQWLNGEDFGALITWENGGEPNKFKIYRSIDGIEYEEIAAIDPTEHQYFDIVDCGLYYYQVTSYNSYCESIPAMTSDMGNDYVIVEVTSVKEGNKNDVLIYPNPTTGNLNIQADNMSNISIYNLAGQKVLDRNIDANETNLNLKSLGNGVYMLRILTNSSEIIKRITIVN